MDTKSAILSLTSSTCTSTHDKMNYALQVALQTMKERCIQLQRRVSNLEEENQQLREGKTSNNINSGQVEDVITVRLKLDEMQRQKEQLEDQINMVSNENRRLWSRLSKISKDQPQLTKEDEGIITTATAVIGANNQNLIRSKTFTQHSPNPHLRQKVITGLSLEEEIPMDEFESELGYPCGLNVDDDPTDANLDAKHCMEGLQDLRREAMKQQQELNSALAKMESRNALHPCPECAQKAAAKPEMADKSLATEDNSESKRYTSSQLIDTINGQLLPTPRLNIIQEKLNADAIDKTCPMCGKLYSSQVSFKAFQEHVEMHFIDDTLDVDGSMERQYEFISHAVGDF